MQMDLNILQLVFQVVNLLFALSLHEAAHAWMASRLGDQTARMLGRVTLNPLRHIDPLGTVVIPLIAAVVGAPLIGWAKPTPVNTRNFKNYVRDDVLTTIAGPASNFLTAVVAFLVLVAIVKTSPIGRTTVQGMLLGIADLSSASILQPIVFLCFWAVMVNLLLTVFNLLPLPPLDGSHLIRHLLPYNLLQIYDRLGMISLILMFLFGGRIIAIFVHPMMALFIGTLLSI
jgi:Zn-dependent protease